MNPVHFGSNLADIQSESIWKSGFESRITFGWEVHLAFAEVCAVTVLSSLLSIWKWQVRIIRAMCCFQTAKLTMFLSRQPLRTCYCHLRSSASAVRSDWYSTGSTHLDCNWTTKFRSQRTSHTKPSATSTMVTGHAGERLQDWRRTCSRPPGAVETSSWFWHRI